MSTERKFPLFDRIPKTKQRLPSGDLLNLFLEYVEEQGLDLYPAQEEAILALFDGSHVILNTPTGSGKSLVATALHFYSLGRQRRSIYTCPIKALVNEKFLALCRDFGPDQVGMVTGDASVNSKAPILCCTAEILSNICLREGAPAPVEDVIMDEFHYYSDPERGVAWQIPLLTLDHSRFLLMSATFGDTDAFEKCLNELQSGPTTVVRSSNRPVPLDFIYRETPIHESIADFVSSGRAPIYLVNFTQRAAAEQAQNLLSADFCTKEEKKKIATSLQDEKFTSPYGKEIKRMLMHGVGLHHAGLLPKYRILVERLAQQGMLKIISGTDTLGVGVNIPIRTVLFTKLCKYDGIKTAILSVRDFHQISGRAGRKGFDTSGTVAAQAPEHVIENKMLEAKAGGDAKKARKIVKRKPPEKGFVMWDAATFKRLIESTSEPLISRFLVTHGMLLNVLSRSGDGCRGMKNLLRSSHESAVSKRRLTKTAFQLFRSLTDRKIIEILPKGSADGQKLRVNLDLQADFSLNHTLSLYLVDTLKLLDPMDSAEGYALNVMTLVESIIENPELILRRQLDRIKTWKMGEMKMAGIEFEERLAELEKLEYPKPNRDFIYDTFNQFAAVHPWVGTENIRPKSIAREMFETFQSFDEYIREYELQASEGLLLRYLSEFYKVLVQTVPDSYRNDEVLEVIAYFSNMIWQIDSSLLDEWERMRVGGANGPRLVHTDSGHDQLSEVIDITRDKRAFTALVRNAIFAFVKALAAKDYGRALAALNVEVKVPQENSDGWTPEKLEGEIVKFYEDHRFVDAGRKARLSEYTNIVRDDSALTWKVVQTLLDPEDLNDWHAEFHVDLKSSKVKGKPVLRLLGLGSS